MTRSLPRKEKPMRCDCCGADLADNGAARDVVAEIVAWFEARALGDEGEGLLYNLKREFGQ